MSLLLPKSWQDLEFSVQRSSHWLQPDSRVGPSDPPGAHSHFAPITLTLVLHSAGLPREPHIQQESILASFCSFSLQPAPGGGIRPGCEAHERRRKGVGSWSAPFCDLGPPSLPDTSRHLWQLPSVLLSYHPHYKCSCSSAADQSHREGSGNAESQAPFPKI